MVGGTTFHWNVISREISRVLVLNLSGECGGGQTAWEKFVLDTAFPLIDGHPPPLEKVRDDGSEARFPSACEDEPWGQFRLALFPVRPRVSRMVPGFLGSRDRICKKSRDRAG